MGPFCILGVQTEMRASGSTKRVSVLDAVGARRVKIAARLF